MATQPKTKADTVEQTPATVAAPAPAQPLATVQPGGGVAELSAVADTFEGMAGMGMEQVTARDTLIPRLTILQKLSPQINRKHIQYLGEHAKEGMICDTGLGELMPIPLHVVPCVWTKTWLEWAPRASGKGIVGYHDESIMRDSRLTPDDRGRPTLNGNLIAETAQWYLLNLSAGGRPSFIAMTSTQLQRSRRWMTWAQAERIPNSRGEEFCPPLFYRTYKLVTPVEETKGDNSWFSWVVERDVALPEMGSGWKNLMQRCVDFAKSITKDQMRADLAAAVTDPLQGEGETIDERGQPVESRM